MKLLQTVLTSLHKKNQYFKFFYVFGRHSNFKFELIQKSCKIFTEVTDTNL